MRLMRRVVTGQRGQDTVEWAGILLLISTVLVAILVAGVPALVANGLKCNVERVFGGAACPSVAAAAEPNAPGADPNAPWSSANPVTRATWGQYVSLGDSYSAGEGLGGYQPGSHINKSQCLISTPFGCAYHKDPKVINGCDRSGSAYNSIVSGKYSFRGGKQTWACSGATTLDVYDPADPRACGKHGHASGRYGEGCQVNRVNPNTSLVTMSIGGNDAGFAHDIQSCYTLDAEKAGTGVLGVLPPPLGPIASGGNAYLHGKHCSDEGPAINKKISAMQQSLIADLQQIRTNAPHARIILITYPRLFPEPPTGLSGCVGPHICLTVADQEFFNQEAVKLDNAICAAAQSAGVGAECINASNAFSGCEVGQANSCVQAPQLHISGSTVVGANPGSFHPTARGQQILGQLINQEILNPPPGVGGSSGP